MKKIFGIVCAALVAGMLTGCASNKKETGNKNWWHNEVLASNIATDIMGEAAIGGVGRSTLSGVAAEKAAKADARASLAQVIGTTVADAIANDLDAETDDDNKEKFSQETRLVANQVLSGSQQVDYYYDEKSETTYVLMGLPLEGLDKKLKSASMKTNNKEVRDFLNTLTNEELKQMFHVK